MAVYVVTGPLGSGKSLLAVSRIQQTLYRGARVATNMDLFLENIASGRKPRDVTRLPDFPSMEDFERLGRGDGYQGKYDEKKFGLIVLDEAAVYLNSRAWNETEEVEIERDELGRERHDEEGQPIPVMKFDKRTGKMVPKKGKSGARRMKMINWMRHARKFGWDIILITQDLNSIDKQIRDGLAEHVVTCRRMDRLAVPLLSIFTKFVGFGAARMPQVHVGIVKYGTSLNAPLADRWILWFGQEFHGAYDTRQRILGDNDGPATMLDVRHAPYLWEPRGLYEAFWHLVGWRWFQPSRARQRRIDFTLFARGLTSYTPAPIAYGEWLRARRATAPEGGPATLQGAGGEGQASAFDAVPDAMQEAA